MPDTEPLIKAEQVAEALGVSRTWVFDRAKAGRLPSYRLGKHVRFRMSEVQAWLAEHREGERQAG